MKEPRADPPLSVTVAKNVDHFIRRATIVGYIGENTDKVGTVTQARGRSY